MSYRIGATVQIIEQVYLGRWIVPLETGEIIGRHTSPAGQEVYDVRMDKDGKEYVFVSANLQEVGKW